MRKDLRRHRQQPMQIERTGAACTGAARMGGGGRGGLCRSLRGLGVARIDSTSPRMPLTRIDLTLGDERRRPGGPCLRPLAELPREDAASFETQRAGGPRLGDREVEDVLFDAGTVEPSGHDPRPPRRHCHGNWRAARFWVRIEE